MSLGVETKVVRAAEAPVTVAALEGLVSCMLPVVPGQFITPGKFPIAPLPLANVGLFTGMGSSVCLKGEGCVCVSGCHTMCG